MDTDEPADLHGASDKGALDAPLADLRRQLGALLAKVEAQERRITALDVDLNLLRAVVLQDRRIDLVRMGQFLTLMFREDMAYQVLPQSMKEQTLYDLERHTVTVAPRNVGSFLEDWRLDGGEILELLVAAFGRHCGQADFIDVGCQYGTLSMHMALFIRTMALDVKVHAFDCGITRQLAGYNFMNNGFRDLVQFYPYAVGGAEGVTLVHRDAGRSEGNRIGGYLCGWERGSTEEAVRCISLDSLVAEGRLTRPVVLKVDTEGAEPAVLRGAGRLLGRRPCAMVLEFTPGGFGRAVGEASPAGFLRKLLQDFHLFDIGRDHAGARRLQETQLEAFAQEVFEHPTGWTDLVALDRESDVCAWLAGKLSPTP